MILTLAGLKGGVGKTTSAVYLAAIAAQEGRTLLVDADPQASIMRWSQLAHEAEQSLPLYVVALPTRTLGRELQGFTDFQHIVIDTPPGHVDIARAAMGEADVVVVPIGGTLIELDRLLPTLDLTREVGKPTVALLVRQRRTRLAQEVDAALIEYQIPTLQTTIPLRTAIEGSFGTSPLEDHGYREAWEELKSIRSVVA